MHVEHQITESVALVTLVNPERHNALTPAIAAELIQVLDELDADTSVGAVVITGAGKGFCSGADLSALAKAGGSPLSDKHYHDIGTIYHAFRRFGTMAVPTIAAVNGAAVGAGLNLAMAADIRIIAEHARLISGFTGIGLHPGGGHLHLLDRLVGRDTLTAMAIFGEEVTGVDAVRLGLAWRAVPAGETVAEATRLAARIATQPELARAVIQTLRAELPGAISWDAAIQLERGPQLRTLHQRAAG